MTTKRKAKKRKRERRNALRRLVATPDERLTEKGRALKHFHLSIQHAMFYGTPE